METLVGLEIQSLLRVIEYAARPMQVVLALVTDGSVQFATPSTSSSGAVPVEHTVLRNRAHSSASVRVTRDTGDPPFIPGVTATHLLAVPLTDSGSRHTSLLLLADSAAELDGLDGDLLNASSASLRRAIESAPAHSSQAHPTLDAASLGIWVTDIDYRIVYVNESFAQLLGWTRSEMIGNNLSEYFPRGVIAAGVRHLNLQSSRKTTFTARAEHRHRSGHRISVTAMAATISDGAGTPSGLIGCVARTANQDGDFREAFESLDRVTRHSPDVMIVFDADSRREVPQPRGGAFRMGTR